MITLKNVSYKNILNDINVNFHKNKINAIIGPSGVGKSTLFKIMYGNITKFNGTINYNDKNITFGVSFELPNFYNNLSIKENLDYFASLQKTDVNYKDLISYFKLDDHVNKKFSQLSKGMQMRINYIRAVMHNPNYVFLDEPTSGLDPLNSLLIKEHIKTLSSTVFITTHNINDVFEISDTVTFIDFSGITFNDTKDNLNSLIKTNKVKITYSQNDQYKTEIALISELDKYLNKDIISIDQVKLSYEQLFIRLGTK